MKKKLLALFLCITMLLGTVALFASCGSSDGDPDTDPDAPAADEGELNPVTQSKNTVTMDLSGADGLQYKVIRCGAYTDVLKQQAIDLVSAISTAAGVTVHVGDDTGSTTNGNFEILLGFGLRDVCSHALNEIEGDGWVIRCFADEGKIVIAGTTEFLTGMAIDYFVENCLTSTKLSGSELTISETIVCSNVEMIEVVGLDKDGKRYEGKYSFVYQNGLDDKKGSAYSETDTVNYDKPVTLAHDLKTAVIAKTGVNQSTLPHETDDIKDLDKSGKREILLGVVDRDEARAALAKLTANQYSLTVTNGTSVSQINLFQQNMFAVRAEIEVGFVAQTAYFNKLTRTHA